MNIVEIRKRFLEKLEDKCIYCFNKINPVLVQSYNQVMNNKTVEIRRDMITIDNDDDPWAKDVNKRIQEHYAKNWDVTIKVDPNGKSRPITWFVFLYKGDLHEVAPEVQKPGPEVKEEKVERIGILDL